MSKEDVITYEKGIQEMREVWKRKVSGNSAVNQYVDNKTFTAHRNPPLLTGVKSYPKVNPRKTKLTGALRAHEDAFE